MYELLLVVVCGIVIVVNVYNDIFIGDVGVVANFVDIVVFIVVVRVDHLFVRSLLQFMKFLLVMHG